MDAEITPLSQRKGLPEHASDWELFPFRLERILSRIRGSVFIELVDGLISKRFDSPLGVIKLLAEKLGDEPFGFLLSKMFQQTIHASFDDFIIVVIRH